MPEPPKVAVSDILRRRMNDLLEIMPDWKTTGTKDLFSDNFFRDNYPEDLRKQTEEIYNKAGEITTIRDIIPENNLRGSFVMEGTRGNVTVGFTLTPETTPRVQSFTISFTPIER